MRRILLPAIALFFAATTAFSQAPVVQSISATNGSYKTGQTINITVTFNIAVDVVASPDGISLALNTTPARFATTTTNSVAPSTTLVLSYLVQANDLNNLTELDYLATNSLTLGAASSIKKNGGGANDANLALPAIGNASSLGGTSNVLVDGVAPSGYSVTIDQNGINNANKAAVSFTFAGAEVGATYNYSINDANVGTAAITGSGTVAAANSQITGINTTTLDDGPLTLTVYLTDVATNQGADVTDTETKDVVAPTAAATYAHTRIQNGVGQTVTLTFSEPLTGTPKITVTGSVSGPIHTNQNMAMTSTSIWTYNAGTVWSGDEVVTITVNTATDATGNAVGTITTNTFVVDNTKPTSAATYTENALNNASPQTITVTFNENVTGATVSLAGSVTGTITTNQPMTGGPLVWTYNAGAAWAGDEIVTVTVAGTDAAGNIVEVNPSTNTFIVDNTTPTSTATFTRNYIKTTTAQTITITFLENITTVPNITVVAPSGTVVNNQPMTGGPLVWTYAAGSTWTGNGLATVTISAGTDAAGNAVATTPATNTFIVDNQIPTAVTINQAGSQSDPAYSTTVDFTVVFTNGPIDPATFTGSDFVVTGGTADYTMGTPTTSDNITWNVVATVTIGSTVKGTIIPTLNLNTVSDLAGNTSGSVNSTSTDNTVEAITEPTTNPTSIAASAVTPNTLTITRTGGNGERYILVGKAGSPVDMVPTDGVNYSEDSDFSTSPDIINGNRVLADITSGTTVMPVTGLAGGVTYHFAIFAYNRGSVNTYNNFRSTGTITSQTTTACTNPTAPATLTTGSNTSTVTLNWTRSTGSDHTLVLLRVDDGTPLTAPTNGFDYSGIDNTNFGTAGTLGNAKVILSDETHNSNLPQSITATSLSAGTIYAFAIYTYNPTTLCYQPSNLTGTRTTTTTTNPELTVTAGASIEPNNISSLGTALTGAVGPQTNAIQNFDFTITDAGADGANGLISQITITQGPNNQITNWSEAISAVQLSDGTNTQNTNVTINAGSIVISSIPNGNGALGRVVDNAAKTYTLTIALRTALLGTLPASIDGKQFDFNVTSAGFTVSASGSLLAAAQSVTSGSGKNVVAALATKISVGTQPSAGAVANVALAAQPRFVAQDPNNNTDLDFNNALTVATTNPTNLGATTAPANFVSGEANFTASGFKFLNTGSSTMSVTANSITSANTNLITVSSATTLGAATVNLAASPIPANTDDRGVFGFSLITNGSSHTVSTLTINTSTDPALVMSNFRLYSNTVDNFATATDLGLAAPTVNATSIAWSGLSIPISSTIKYFYLVGDVNPSFTSGAPAIQFQLFTGGYTVSLTGSTLNGISQFRNCSFQDVTPPQIASIVVPTVANPALNGIGSSHGATTQSTSLNFTVTFDEPVFGLSTDNFYLTSLDPGNALYPSANGTVTGISGVNGSTTYVITTNFPTGTGRLRLDFDPFANFLTDNVGNQCVTSFLAGDNYAIVLPEPSNVPTSFSVAPPTITTSNTQVNWSGSTGLPITVNRPTHVLILARGPATGTETTPLFPAVVDGVPVPNDVDFSDGLGAINITLAGPGAAGSHLFTTLRSGRNYQFALYPYSLSPNNPTLVDNTNFKTTGNLTTNATTLTATLGTIEPGSTTAAAVIPATQTTFGSKNFSFKVKDDGGSPTADDAKLQFTYLTIYKGATDNVLDWSAVIAEAELVDITDNNTITTASNAIIGVNYIQFQNLSTADNAIGSIDDNQTKEYELRIRLKNPMTSAAQLTIDDKQFEFAVHYYSFSTIIGSSNIISAPAEFETSGSANRVEVTADRIVFAIEPPPNALVLADLTQIPEVRAVDANGNVDNEYNTSLPIANSGALPMSQTAISGVSGRYIFPADFHYTDDGAGTANNGNLTLTATGLSVSNTAISGNVSVSYTATTTITPGFFTEEAIFPTSDPDYILSAPTTTPNSYPFAFDFQVNDDNNVSVGTDKAPTKISQIVITAAAGNDIADWSQALTQALLYNGYYTWATGASIGTNSITFTLNPNTSGLVNDDGSVNFRLYIWLKPNLGGTLPATIDNKNFVFEVVQSNIQTVIPSSIIPVSETENSGATNNSVQVVATALNWITSPAPDLLVNKDISLQLPKPVLEAVDLYGNRDLDYVSAVSISNTNTPTIQMSALAQSNLTTVSIPADGAGPSNGGLFTFPNNFQFDQISNGLIRLSAVSSGTSTVLSDPTGFQVRVAKSTTIKQGPDLEPGFFSSLNTTSSGVQVFDFIITDDDGAEDDGNATQMTSMTIVAGGSDQITSYDWSNAIAGATLTDGTNTIFANSPITANSFTFNMSAGVGAALGNIADDQFKHYKLNIWLRSPLGGTLREDIDGKKFQFQVSEANILMSSNGTDIIDSESRNSGVSNEVDVDASQLVYSNPTGPTSASIDADFPSGGSPVQLVARDARGNKDKDFVDVIRSVTNNAGVSMQDNGVAINTGGSSLMFGTSAFTAGIFTFPTNFRFTTGNNGDNVALTVTAGANVACNGTTNICGTTLPITLKTSFESAFILNPTFTLPISERIPYINYYQPGNTALTTANSYELMRALLIDGSRTAFPYTFTDPNTAVQTMATLTTGTDEIGDGFPNGDIDGAATRLTALTLRITNPSNISNIQLFNTAGPIAGTFIDVTAIGAINATTGSYDFAFSGAPLLAASDDQLQSLSVRVTFRNAAPDLMDQEIINVQVVSAILGTGSQYFTAPVINQSFGSIDVVATNLDFVQQGSAYAGTDEPLGPSYHNPLLPATQAAVVHARDDYSQLDLDFNYIPTISGGNPQTSATFVAGILDLDGMIYKNAGQGKLTIEANSLNSDDPTTNVPATNVDVVHVATSLAAITTPPNLKGGTQGAVLLGVTFAAPHVTPTHPALKKFTFSFKDNPYQTGLPGALKPILKNFKVRIGSSDVSTTGATVTTGSSTNDDKLDLVIVDWGVGSLPLFDVAGAPVSKTFYLVADVDITAKIGTPKMTPQLIDLGYNDVTDARIITTNGTARSNIIGQGFTFASTRPPVLLTHAGSLTSPYNGQLNVNKAMTQIKLNFDVPVWSLDGAAELRDRNTNELIAKLVAANGNVATGGFSTPAANPLTFNIIFEPGKNFQDDGLYYVTIKKGTYDNLTSKGEGISDDGLNYYGGISSNSILFFKISSPVPPVLSNANVLFNNSSTVVFQTTFDQRGTAYYMIVPAGDPKPSNDNIMNVAPYPGTAIDRGNYPITLVNEPQTVTASELDIPLSASTILLPRAYDIWVFAKNDANPSNISTGAPYGGQPNNYLVVSGGSPTINFTTGTSFAPGYKPSYSLCPDSYFLLTEPIIIGELALGGFNQGAAFQDFNLILPPGFEFDGITKPTVQLVGSDFVGSATVTWKNNTLVNIKYKNSTSGSLDKIIISNMRIRGLSGSATNTIDRFAGNATIGPAIALADIQLFELQYEQSFTNSFTIDNDFTPFGFATGDVITAIPDNYIDKDAALTGAIRLIPLIKPANDYGITSFSGNGVTNDVLTLSAVALNTSFDITMTHTDLNGCIATDAVQYVVYDNTAPISTKLGLALVGVLSPVPGGKQQGLINDNFPDDATAVSFPNPNVTKHPLIQYKDKAGYKLLQMRADLGTSAVMTGDTWSALVAKIPKVVKEYTLLDDADLPHPDSTYKDYQWDYNYILNAVSQTQAVDPLRPLPPITQNPYDVFKEVIDVGAYWRGGSLGKIVFTGTFQSTADLQILVPFRQEVELFVPPIPLVVVSGTPPVAGVPTYCEFGGGIVINGWPAATSGVSESEFYIYDNATYVEGGPNTELTYPAGAFVDNGNGTATLYPRLPGSGLPGITNSYDSIRIVYRFQENNSPSEGFGYAVIRITPNPVASFTTTTRCEDINVTFKPVDLTPVMPSGIRITKYNWNFGDVNSATNIDTAKIPIHVYASTGFYPAAKLDVTTNVGCMSTQPYTEDLQIGGTPNAAFDFSRVAVTENLIFKSLSTVSSNDTFKELLWEFGDTQSTLSTSTDAGFNPSAEFLHKYSAPGINTVKLTATSTIGCVNSLVKKVIVLPRVKKDVTNPNSFEYQESFETGSGDWQTAPTDGFGQTSWKRGSFTKAFMKPTSANGQFYWATNNSSGSIEKGETSALYSPSFDISTLSRPMVSFDAFVDLDKSDGVIIEYSIDTLNAADPNKKWHVLGNNIAEGVDWFNERNLSGSPGNQANFNFGWTRQADATSAWLHAKHSLNNLGNDLDGNPKPAMYKATQIVFRFALGSNTPITPITEGFAIDNFRIGERTRIVLLENFTNLTNEAANGSGFVEDVENNFITANFLSVPNNAVVKLDYHVAFPKPDPLNLDNEQDPGARALYYNVSTTPRVRMDGEVNGGNQLFSTWGQQEYSVRSLKLADAIISLANPNPIDVDGNLNLVINIDANRDLPASTILNVALVEKSILKSSLASEMQSLVRVANINYTYVVKKLLPNAAGTKFGTPLLKSDAVKPFGPFAWPDDLRSYGPEKDLAVVVFLQDETTKEIYQTEIFDLTENTPVLTGIEDINASFNVYPNPADNEMAIELPENITEGASLRMFDQVGKIVNETTFEKGEHRKTLNTSTHAGGVYLIQVKTSKGILTRKVMVLHDR